MRYKNLVLLCQMVQLLERLALKVEGLNCVKIFGPNSAFYRQNVKNQINKKHVEHYLFY